MTQPLNRKAKRSDPVERPAVMKLLDDIRQCPMGDTRFWQLLDIWCLAAPGDDSAVAAEPIDKLLGHLRDRLAEHQTLLVVLAEVLEDPRIDSFLASPLLKRARAVIAQAKGETR